MDRLMKSKVFFQVTAAMLLLGLTSGSPAQAAPICSGGGVIKAGGTIVGCIFPGSTWDGGQVSMCNGAVMFPTLPHSPCHACAVEPYATNIQNGNWSGLSPSDLTCIGCIDPPSGLVGWWPLDETSLGYAANPLSWDTWGWQVGNPVPTPAKVLYGLQLDGNGDYVQVDDFPDLNFGTGDFSFDAWVRFTAVDSTSVRTLVDKRTTSPYRGYSFFLYNGRPGVQLADGTSYGNYIASVAVPSDNNWHLVAVTVSRTQGARFYINGNLVSGPISVAGQPGSLVNTSPLRIGTHSFDLYTSFRGGIDEVELFNRALTSQEVQALYQAKFYGKCKPPMW